MKALVIGGGVAGCVASSLLYKKGYQVTLLEKTDGLGGLSRTFYYNGHPYEFGPHVWCWPKRRENELIQEVTNGELFNLDVKLYCFTGNSLWRYPIHLDDVMLMPEKEQILNEWKTARDNTYHLDITKLPDFNNCTYEYYFTTILGPTLYTKFMKNYTHKMWGVSGSELRTLTATDKLPSHFSNSIYDPIKFVKQHYLGTNMNCWYPKKGWNPVWQKLSQKADIHYNVKEVRLSNTGLFVDLGDKQGIIQPSEYDAIISTIHIDTLFGECQLPTNGRLVIPFLIPGLDKAFPDTATVIHYADNVAITRALEFKRITQYESPDTLITLEIPIIGGNQPIFPSNVEVPAHVNKRCYPRQTEEALTLYQGYVDRMKKISSNIFLCGRDARFQYLAMPHTVEDVINTIEQLP